MEHSGFVVRVAKLPKVDAGKEVLASSFIEFPCSVTMFPAADAGVKMGCSWGELALPICTSSSNRIGMSTLSGLLIPKFNLYIKCYLSCMKNTDYKANYMFPLATGPLDNQKPYQTLCLLALSQ